MEKIIPLFVAIPLGAAFLLPILSRLWKRLPDVLANLTTLSLFALSLAVINQNFAVYKVGGWEPVEGVPIGIYMVLDGFSILMLVIINLIMLLATIYSVNYMAKFTDKTRYYTLFLLMLAGMNGVVLSGDMFNIFVFLEITAIASYALVAFTIEAEALEAGFKYQVMGTVASALILLGIAFLYSLTGTLNMADMGNIISQKPTSVTVLFVGALFLAGFGLKAGLMPFHAWLPDAYPSAPAPVSAVLSGVVGKSIGVYALCRIFFNVLGLGAVKPILNLLIILGMVSMVAGALAALGQKDFKRLLAYSSVSQIGHIIFAIGLGTPLGFLGALFHLVNHSVIKSLLFLNSGAVVYSTGQRDMEKLGGLSQRMPVTGATFVVGSMSLAGIPPFNGFWSKLIIVLAAIQAGHPILALMVVLVSIITLAYYLRALKLVFFGKLSQAFGKIKEAPVLMCTSMIILAGLCFGLGLLLLPGIRTVLLEPGRSLLLGPAVEVLENGLEYASPILGK